MGIKRVDNPNHLEGRIKKEKNIIAASSSINYLFRVSKLMAQVLQLEFLWGVFPYIEVFQ